MSSIAFICWREYQQLTGVVNQDNTRKLAVPRLDHGNRRLLLDLESGVQNCCESSRAARQMGWEFWD
jgi:hypothetical protein